jgi:hypothetical protein
MKFAAFLFVGLLVTFAAQAAPATSDLSWTAPTTRVDGTPLQVEDIAEYRVYYSVDNPVTVDSTEVVVGGSEVASTITLTLVPRADPYVVSFAVATVDTDGRVSALSEIVSKTFVVNSTAAPMPPTSLVFSITCIDECTIKEL